MPIPFNLRFAALLVALPVSVLASSLFSGCGGGSSGGGPASPTATPTTPAPNGQLFFDDFDAAALNRSQWGVYNQSQQLQRTFFGPTPALLSESGTTFARLQLDTYNNNRPGNFQGTEIYSLDRFPRGNGIEIESRLRGPITQPGIVFAFFTIFDRFNGGNYSKTEIDFEFLTAELEQFRQSNRLYLNIWDDWNEARDGYDGDDVETPSRIHDDKTYRSVANFNWQGWNTYKIRWYPDRTEFLLNNVIQRTEREVLPNEDMSVHFNIWSGESSFRQAYSPTFNPTNAAGSQKYAFDVDYVRVRQLTPTTTRPSSFLKYQIPVLPAGVAQQRNR